MSVVDRPDSAPDGTEPWAPEVISRFEAAWRSGERPRIEDLLAGTAPADRASSLEALIRSEADLRRASGESPTPGEYRARFPGDPGAVAAAFAEGDETRPTRLAPDAPSGGAARELFLALLAVQNGFIGLDTLVDAVHAWMLDKERPMGSILLEFRAIEPGDLALLNGLLDRQLERHGGDAARGIDSIGGTQTLRSALGSTADAEVATLILDASRRDGAADDGFRMPRGPSDGRDGCRYRILEHHARGGLGDVYVARDLELDRKVALKEIQPQFLRSEQYRASFVLEGEVTGNLEHPGIVPIYGSGKYRDGRPFYAMRFIKGETLKDAVARSRAEAKSSADRAARASGLRKLLRRFLDACNAIEYAHSRGVLHRDLKPSNIMLGKFGETLVVDWGLAKVIDRPDPEAKPDADEEDLLRLSAISGVAPTRMASVKGTPQFMSPEQAAGRVDQHDRATDVYGLGATLYHLLTGKPPFPKGSIDELRPPILKGEFPPPREVDESVPRPLEAICLKAMAIEPEDRYPSAAALAEDVERWLNDEPVAAYPDPPSARALRWTRRHRPLVAGVAALLVASTAYLAISNALVRAEREKTRIEQVKTEAARKRVLRTLVILAETLDRMMYGLSSPALANTAGMIPLRDYLTSEAKAVARKIMDEWPDDPAVARLAAPVFHRVANLDRLLGHHESAFASYRQSLKLLDASASAGGTEAGADRRLASFVAVDFAEGFRMARRYDEAFRQYDDAQARVEALRLAEPGEVAHEKTLARVLYNRAGPLLATGRAEEARAHAERSVSGLERVIARRGKDAETQLLRTIPLAYLGVAERHLGRYVEAGAALDRAVANLDGVPGPLGSSNDAMFLRSWVLEEKGWLLATDQARLAEADRAFGSAVAMMERLTEDFREVPHYRGELAVALLGRATARAGLGTGRRDEASLDALDASRILEALLADSVEIPQARGFLGEAFGLLGRLSGDREYARSMLRKAEEAQRLALKDNPRSPRDAEALRRHVDILQAIEGP